MDDFIIIDYIETIIAADGNDAKLCAAMVTVDEKIQEITDKPFANAKSMGLPTGWIAKIYSGSWEFWSPDALAFRSKKAAMDFIALKSGDQSGKFTDEICNAKSLRLPVGWKATKNGTVKNWICVNPDGKSFTSLKTAKDSLISLAYASLPTMANADASTKTTDVTSLTQCLEIAETEISEMKTIISQMATMLSGLGCEFEMTKIEDAKPSVAEPAAKSTKAKKATKPEAKKVTRPIKSFWEPQAARVSLDGPSFSSAIAVTAKKGKGKKRSLLESDDEYELSSELSSSPDF